MKQNIYDDKVFFDSYKDLRDGDKGFNEVIEVPIIKEILGDVNNKVVLDLGCGFGHQAQYLLDNNVKSIIGVDISERMIDEAKSRIQSKNVNFVCQAIEDYKIIIEQFDIIVSSMALHYIENLELVFQNIYAGLKDKGQFVFSMEHPICTALLNNWINTERGKVWPVARYSDEGIRHQNWIVSGVKKYHRKISTITNLLMKSGFQICRIEEPEPKKDIFETRPDLILHRERPPILIIEAKK